MHSIHLKYCDQYVKHCLYQAAPQNPPVISLRITLVRLYAMILVLLLPHHLRHKLRHLVHQFTRRFQIIIPHLILQRLLQLLCDQLRLHLLGGWFPIILSHNTLFFVDVLPFVVGVHVPRVRVYPPQVGAGPDVHLDGDVIFGGGDAHPIPSGSLYGLRPLVGLNVVRQYMLNAPAALLLVFLIVRALVPGVLLPLQVSPPLFLHLLLPLPRQVRPGRCRVLVLARVGVIYVERVVDDPFLLKFVMPLLDERLPVHDPILHQGAQLGLAVDRPPHAVVWNRHRVPLSLPVLVDGADLGRHDGSLDLHRRLRPSLLVGVDYEYFKGREIAPFE
mmetsp:Transcript_16378/g.35622  ORF Transcript_16378/g.35622 Transcript_16378/m.35622 type:complete len:332 (+) Transcript_16378:133-1128(+)